LIRVVSAWWLISSPSVCYRSVDKYNGLGENLNHACLVMRGIAILIFLMVFAVVLIRKIVSLLTECSLGRIMRALVAEGVAVLFLARIK